jgi:O-antigen/teichoic acid export membrane protein
MESVLIISAGIAPVLLSRVANSADPPRSAPLALALAKASLALSALFALLIVLLPEQLFTSVLGKGFAGIKPVMLMYAPAVLFISFFGTLSQFFSAVGRQRTVLICYSAGFLHTLVAGPFFVHRFGIYGAALTACVSFFLMLLGISALFMKAGNIRPRDFLMIRPDFRLLLEEVFRKSPVNERGS